MQAYQNALALTQLGGLGGTQGVAAQVRSLGADIEQQGKQLEDQIRALADAQQVTLGDQLAATDEATLAQLRGQSGPPFDAAWLRTAQQLEQQARDWATGVQNDPNASPDAKGGARELIAKLDAMRPRLQAALAAAGAGGQTGGAGINAGSGSGAGSGTGSGASSGTPRSVDAGTGGQAASEGATVLPSALVGIVVVLLGAALFWLRRSPRS